MNTYQEEPGEHHPITILNKGNIAPVVTSLMALIKDGDYKNMQQMEPEYNVIFNFNLTKVMLVPEGDMRVNNSAPEKDVS